MLVGGAGNDEDERHPEVTRPVGRFTLHNHCGNSGSEVAVVLGIWYPYAFAAVFVGVKLAMTAAIHAGTLDALPQFGAPGSTGLAKLGFVPSVLFEPRENPELLFDPSLFPLAANPQFDSIISVPFPPPTKYAKSGFDPHPSVEAAIAKLFFSVVLNALAMVISPHHVAFWCESVLLPQTVLFSKKIGAWTDPALLLTT